MYDHDDRDQGVVHTRSQYLHPEGQIWVVDRHPDKRPSHSRYFVEEFGVDRDLIWVLEVRGLGAIVMRADAIDGDVHHGMSTFSNDEIQFEKA